MLSPPTEWGADTVPIEGTCAFTCPNFNSAAKVKMRFNGRIVSNPSHATKRLKRWGK